MGNRSAQSKKRDRLCDRRCAGDTKPTPVTALAVSRAGEGRRGRFPRWPVSRRRSGTWTNAARDYPSWCAKTAWIPRCVPQHHWSRDLQHLHRYAYPWIRDNQPPLCIATRGILCFPEFVLWTTRVRGRHRLFRKAAAHAWGLTSREKYWSEESSTSLISISRNYHARNRPARSSARSPTPRLTDSACRVA